MTDSVTDRERFWAETQQFFDDVDSEDSGVGFAQPPPDRCAQAGELEPNPGSDAPDDTDPAALDRGPDAAPSSCAAPNGADHLGHSDSDQYHTNRKNDSSPTDSDTEDRDTADPNDRASVDGRQDNAQTDADQPAAPARSTWDASSAAARPATVSTNADSRPAAPRYNKRIAVGFAVATAVAALLVSGALLAMRSTPHIADPDHSSRPSTQLSVVSAPTTSTVPIAGGQDSPIPYIATAVGCLPGSTTAQSVAGSDPTQAWVCVHGGTVGQYLVLELGRTMVITAVSITPGWVGANTSGADQWLQHRVLTRLQWSFNDTPPTVVSQETHSVHGEAPQPIPGRGVLASRIIVLIQDTGRAPADAPSAASTPPRPGGLFGDVLGTPAPASTPPTTAPAPGMPADQTDPADNTFAVSAIKIFGHPPQ